MYEALVGGEVVVVVGGGGEVEGVEVEGGGDCWNVVGGGEVEVGGEGWAVAGDGEVGAGLVPGVLEGWKVLGDCVDDPGLLAVEELGALPAGCAPVTRLVDLEPLELLAGMEERVEPASPEEGGSTTATCELATRLPEDL